MKRRGFLGLFGAGAAAAFVPFVVPESMTGAPLPPPAAPAPVPPVLVPPAAVRAKAWVFGSQYRNLRIQIAERKAVQFHGGYFRTEDPKEAEAVREALVRMNAMHSFPNVAWEEA